MVDKKLWEDAIASAFAPRNQPVQQNDLAQYILTHSMGGPKVIGKTLAAKQGATTEKPSLVSRILDVMSTPLYTMEGALSDSIDSFKREKSDSGDNPISDIAGPIVRSFGSLGKNLVGNVARTVEDEAAIAGQVTGLNKTPVVGKILQGLESGGHNIAEGLAPRATGAKNLEKVGVTNPILKYGLGFGLDVALDPTTYLTLGGSAAAKGSKFATEAMGYRSASEALDQAAATGQKANVFARPKPVQLSQPTPVAEQALGRNLIPQTSVPQIPNLRPTTRPSQFLMAERGIEDSPEDMAAMQQLRRSDNAKRAANVRWGKPADWHDIPDMTLQDKADFADMFRDGKLAKAGKVTDGKGNISQRGVAQVLEDVKNGTVPRFGPVPEAATGDLAVAAQRVADQVEANLSKATRKGRSVKELTPADQANLYNSLRNTAAEMLNVSAEAKATARAEKALTPRQQNFFDEMNAWGKQESITRGVSEKEIRDYIEAGVANKVITKTDSKAILRKLFPPEPIHNPAVTKYGAAQIDNMTKQMLRSAEDHLLSKGVQPVYWNGMRVRLSDVMEEIGPAAQGEYHTALMDAMMHSDTKRIGNPVVQEAINKALARRSLSMSDLLANLSQKTAQVKGEVLDKYPHPVAQKILDGLGDSAATEGKLRGATAVEAQAFRDQVGNIINVDNIPTEDLFVKLGDELVQAVMDNRVNAEQAMKISAAVRKTINETPKSLMTDITGNKVVDGFMTRFSTYFGRIPEMRRFADDVFIHGELNAGMRTAWLRNMSKNYSADQLHRGFALARTPELIAAESDQKAVEVANVFKNYFDSMLGSTGFNKIVDANNTPAVRSGMIMTDVNKHLKAVNSNFRFTDAKFKDKNGLLQDYTGKGKGWLHSWEQADPLVSGQDPISLIHDIDIALQRTVAEYNLFDEFGMRFGAKVGDAHFNPAIHKESIPSPRLKGLQFHPEVRKAFQRQINDLEKGSWMPTNKQMRMITQATRAWKSSVTIYFPAHHIRNMIGDSYNMWWAGINDPRVFKKALRVLESQKPRYAEALRSNDLSALEQLISNEGLSIMQLGGREAKAKDLIINARGTKLTSEQLWGSAYQRGLLLNYNKIEDLFGQTPMGAVFKNTPEDSNLRRLAAPFGGRAHHVAARISEHREHYVRMAHYIGAVEKRLKKGEKDLQKIFDDAAHEVRKWHPDGSDLTRFEQKARILVPFYSWTRKEIPLLLQTMVQKPAKITAFPRAERAIAGASGIDVNDEQGFLDPYPNDQLFPYWIRASGIGPIGDPESQSAVARFWSKFGATTFGLNGPEGYTSINPSNPFHDVATQIFGFGRPQDTLRGIENSLNPGVQIPMSLFSNTTFSGAPISKDEGGLGYGQYLASQLPQVGTFTRLTGIGKDAKETTQGQNLQNTINFLTALGIRGSGPYQKSAEFEAKDRKKYGQ